MVENNGYNKFESDVTGNASTRRANNTATIIVTYTKKR